MTTHNSPYGVAPLKLQLCPNCTPTISLGRLNHPPDRHPKFLWAVELACPLCNCVYTICKLCPFVRNHLINNAMIQRHNRDYHTGREIARRPVPPPHCIYGPTVMIPYRISIPIHLLSLHPPIRTPFPSTTTSVPTPSPSTQPKAAPCISNIKSRTVVAPSTLPPRQFFILTTISPH